MTQSSIFFVYILKCSDGTFYVGKTTNIEKRIRQHNGELKGGAKYTRNRRPVHLYYSEKFVNHKQAAQREYVLQEMTHKYKEKLGKL